MKFPDDHVHARQIILRITDLKIWYAFKFNQN